MTTNSRVASMLVHPRLRNSEEKGEAYSVNVEFNKYIPDRRTLVLLHGYMGSLEDWEPAFEKLSTRYNLIAVELRGHGTSTYPAEDDVSWGMSDFAIDIVQVVQLIAPDAKFSIMASSMSTAISLEIARLYPELVENLFLMSPTSKFSIPTWVKFVLGIGKISPAKFVEGVIDAVTAILSKLSSKEEKEFWEDGLARFQNIDFVIHQKIFEEALTKWELDSIGINHPIFIVAGKKDNVVPYEQSLGLMNLITNSSLLTFEEAQHHLIRKEKDIIFDLIIQWVEETDEMLENKYYTDNDLIKVSGRYVLSKPNISSDLAQAKV